MVYLGTKRLLAEGPGGDESDSPLNSSYLVLAAKRTYRRDPLNGFKKYTGGYNITERHYWAVSPPQILILFLCFRKQFFLFGRNAIQMKTSSPDNQVSSGPVYAPLIFFLILIIMSPGESVFFSTRCFLKCFSENVFGLRNLTFVV